jgi:hypothetical protein
MQNKSFIDTGVKVLLALTAIYIILFDPFGAASQKIVLLALLVGFSAWSFVRHWREADEVQLAATKFGAGVGAGIGMLVAFVFVVVMRHIPSVAESIASIAARSSNDLPQAAVGFALGALSTILIVLFAGVAAKTFWWSARN